MKTILYFLIAILLLSIIIPGYSVLSASSHNMVFQVAEAPVTSSELSVSAEIISKRLKSFSNNKFEIQVVPEKSQIRLTLDKKWEPADVEKLVMQRGNLEFYETFNRNELTELFTGNAELFSVLSNCENSGPDFSIVCVSPEKVEYVNQYLDTIAENVSCKFAWRIENNSSECYLYALKDGQEKGALLDKSDIEMFQAKEDKSSGYFQFEVRFKEQSAKLWAEATRQNINRVIALVLDENVIYAPVLKSEILNGACTISGNFSDNEARLFTSIINSQTLPVDFIRVKD